ncbi:MAG: hypothetical protein COW63_09030 [Bacteroidetes bacterium CG18_big_fil_WC_8_21_14_2_50_41_14]|nr:MAG: hypothetical protein COW63_09030 [Bacteroidetes bacterium CG18_big_fil_WC_8_21_14_2_50_41_14]PJB58391.1 MAG: hypothetical protein CO098_08895 [Bacteroidetes bacterium CG_4_9_14_3_um_filter_41_19]
MIKYFSKSYFSRYAWLLTIVVVGWLPQFIHPAKCEGFPSYLFLPFQSVFDSFPITGIIFTLLVYVFSVFFLNFISIEHHISGKVNTLPIFIYILFTASISAYFTTNSFIWISLLLLWMLRHCLSLYQRESTITNALNAGLLLSVASFFYPPLIYLILLIWFSLLLHRVNSWRAYVTSLLGLLGPYLFLLTWFFMTDQLKSATANFVGEILPVVNFKPDLPWTELAVFTLLLLLGILFSVKLASSLGEKNINLRRNLFILLLFFAFQLLLILIFNKSSLAFMLLGIPYAFIVAHQLVLLKKTRLINLILLVITLFIVGNHLMILFNAY